MTNPRTFRAFPSVAIDDRAGGMTLRDWFAGQALNARLTHHDPAFIDTFDLTASWSYEVADAMLEAREEGSGSNHDHLPCSPFTAPRHEAGETIQGYITRLVESLEDWSRHG